MITRRNFIKKIAAAGTAAVLPRTFYGHPNRC